MRLHLTEPLANDRCASMWSLVLVPWSPLGHRSLLSSSGESHNDGGSELLIAKHISTIQASLRTVAKSYKDFSGFMLLLKISSSSLHINQGVHGHPALLD